MPKDVRTYINRYPKKVRRLLKMMRQTLRKAVPPMAQERISYRIPAFLIGSRGVHYAAFAHHIGFYPGAAPIRKFRKDLRAYRTAKGSVRFPLDRPLPLALVSRITKFRMSPAGR